MKISAITAGLLSAIPIGLINALIIYLRANNVVVAVQKDPPFNRMSFQQIRLLFTAAFGLGMFVLGPLSGLAYQFGVNRWHWQGFTFLGLAVGLAILLSILALVSRTPFAGEKIIMNFVVGIGFGLLIPWLTKG
jgi:hypothetical protein